jgi:hypothetical protein
MLQLDRWSCLSTMAMAMALVKKNKRKNYGCGGGMPPIRGKRTIAPVLITMHYSLPIDCRRQTSTTCINAETDELHLLESSRGGSLFALVGSYVYMLLKLNLQLRRYCTLAIPTFIPNEYLKSPASCIWVYSRKMVRCWSERIVFGRHEEKTPTPCRKLSSRA